MGKTIKKTTEQFIEQSTLIHNGKFDYSLVEYKNTNTKVKIICPTHGMFEQLPMSHIKGIGCYDCSGKKKHNQNDFISKMKQIHIDKGITDYDYSLVNYKNLDTKIKITCKTHGDFEITPRSILLQQAGCVECGRSRTIQSRIKSVEDFTKEATIIHKGKYEYTKVVYVNSRTKVIIDCKNHGEFLQRPDNHLYQHRGCPECKRDKLKENSGGYTHTYFENNPNQKTIPGILYVMNIINGNERFIKIGITSKSIYHRYNRGEYNNMTINTLCKKNMTLFEAFNIEQSLLEELKPFKFFSNSKFSGYTECFNLCAEVKTRINEIFKL